MSDSRAARDRILDDLVDLCGPGLARAARSVDRVGERRAEFVAVPATSGSVAATLRLAADRGLAFLPRGSGSKIDWGVPPARVDLLVDTARLNGMWHHDGSGVTVATGTPVHAVQAALALRGQRLAVDPPSPGATVGGMLAVNEAGPLRYRFGTPAEQALRISYVDAAGRELESDGEGGRPGTGEVDGVITSAVLQVSPLPTARRWVERAVTNPAEVHDLVNQAGGWEPSAIEVDLPGPGGGVVAVLVEGDPDSVTGRAEKIAQTWGEAAATLDAAPSWWGRYPFAREDVALRIAVQPADLHAVAYGLRDVAGQPVTIRGSAGVGTVHAVLPRGLTAARVEEVVDAIRQVLLARGGRAVVVSAPATMAREIEMAERRQLF